MSASLHHGEPSGQDRGYDAALRRQRLSRAVEPDVPPRLSQRTRAPRAAPGRAAALAHAETLARLAAGRDESAPAAYVAALRAQGAGFETICLDVIAPAARVLGALWEDDDLDFLQVTEGSGRLQRLLHAIGREFSGEVPLGAGRRALLAPAPGEQHTLGLTVLGVFFRRAGWDVWTGPAAEPARVVELVRRERFAVVGFSAACDASLDGLSGLVGEVRGASCDRCVRIMVGGPAFAARPELARRVGADATAADARQAVAWADAASTTPAGRD